MDLPRAYGLDLCGHNLTPDRSRLRRLLGLRLAALGLPQGLALAGDPDLVDAAGDLLALHREQERLLDGRLCPADARIQAWLDRLLAGIDCGGLVRVPAATLVLDRHGLARELSLPVDAQAHDSEILASRRLPHGVLHNPASDRRTTQGSFHIAAGGLPVPDDKKEVPLVTFGRLLRHALVEAPTDSMALPWLAGSGAAGLFTSLLLRPLVVPAVPGWRAEQRMEIRFFAPGSLVANLDFVESIFGNAGDPRLPECDAALDPAGWTGTTGCVILAPHLARLTKRELGLPPIAEATPRQRRDGMCWADPAERYNDGSAFKLCARDASGVIVTLIADNYFGYCKKEVKTQISYSANLGGLAEEEHAGGALAFPRFSHGDEFHVDTLIRSGPQHTLEAARTVLGPRWVGQPEGYGRDAEFPGIVYCGEDLAISLPERRVRFTTGSRQVELPLLAGEVYVHPSGWRVHLDKHPGASSWRLIGTQATGIFCHKPCTVSGGGKSEISKNLADAIHYGPIYTADLEQDLDQVAAIIARDCSDRMLPHLRPDYSVRPSRPVLSQQRSLGSVIKMFTPSESDFTPAYNAWLHSVPARIWSLLFIIKRFYRQEWGEDWRRRFQVDIVDGRPGHELKYRGRALVGSYLRVGMREDGSWRTFKLRQDFLPAHKVQMEDDISAAVVVPAAVLGAGEGPSLKLVANCEHRLFQRPDDAIHRGYDAQAEADLAAPGLFCSNYEPLDAAAVAAERADAMAFERYTAPMREHLLRELPPGGCTISSAQPRLIGGKPSKNPRYLQVRPDLADPIGTALAGIATRLHCQVGHDQPLPRPVDAVLCGRRNNPPEAGGIRPLAVYGPIHYQELPELFMDFIASLTGKSPSTTGAGSEGALTKAPFNALRATADLNAALLSYILCGHDGFSTPAGHIGVRSRVDHDISLLIPELWCRLSAQERSAAWLIGQGHLERVADREHAGKRVLASRLGWRITAKFVHTFLGKIFDHPAEVFPEEMLRPELQNAAAFADGVDNIVAAQQRAAQAYFDDGAIEEACPPLRALLEIMAHGSSAGRGLGDPGLRRQFTREAVLGSEWYQARLDAQHQRDLARARQGVADLESFLNSPGHVAATKRLDLSARLVAARAHLAQVRHPSWRVGLVGSIGVQPLAGVLALV